MIDNGKSIDVVKVTLVDGAMQVSFDGSNVALISHALRLASLQLDNYIVAKAEKDKPKVVPVSPTLMERMRRGV